MLGTGDALLGGSKNALIKIIFVIYITTRLSHSDINAKVSIIVFKFNLQHGLQCKYNHWIPKYVHYQG